MDGWLKALIATACVVIIAGGGYYGWLRYGQFVTESERAVNEESARKEIFSQAGSDDGDTAKVRTYCNLAVKIANSDTSGDVYIATIARNCRFFGYAS